MQASILASVFANGCRICRYDDFAIVTVRGCSFATTPMEFDEQQDWARSCASTGDPTRDCALFLGRFETVIGRDGSGIATKGGAMAQLRIIKAMKASSVFMDGWDAPSKFQTSIA